MLPDDDGEALRRRLAATLMEMGELMLTMEAHHQGDRRFMADLRVARRLAPLRSVGDIGLRARSEEELGDAERQRRQAAAG